LIGTVAAPELNSATVSLVQDLAVDAAGRIFVPAIWHYQPKNAFAGFFAMSAQGVYLKTLVQSTRVATFTSWLLIQVILRARRINAN
jgi:hypothetical protein